MLKKSWMKLGAIVVSGATLFQLGGGCLNQFWRGFFNEGWPSDNRWLNLTIDILNEELFG
jgi:hypothetical protein